LKAVCQLKLTEETIRFHRERTKDAQGSNIYSHKLRDLRAFVVDPFFIAFFEVKFLVPETKPAARGGQL